MGAQAAADPYAAFADPDTSSAPAAGDPYATLADPASPLDTYQANPTFGNAYRAATSIMDETSPIIGALAGAGRTIVAGTAGVAGKLVGRVRDMMPGGADWNPSQPRAADSWGDIAANAVPPVGPVGQAVENTIGKAGQAVGDLMTTPTRTVLQKAGVPSSLTQRIPLPGPITQTATEAGSEALQDIGLVTGAAGAARGLARTVGRGATATAAEAAPGAATSTASEPAAATAPGAPANPPKFETAPPASAAVEAPPVTSPEQAERAATLQSVGMQEARQSAITGDKKAAATDYQQSKLDGEGGKEMASAFSNERATLDNYTDQLAANAGGSSGLDETSLHNRGQTILKPFQDVSDHIDSEIKTLYQQADAKAGGVPLDLDSTAKVMADKPQFIGTVDGQQLLKGANAYLRQAGIADETGELGGATAQQAERFKQYLNQQWTPQNGRLVRALKDAVDDDVTRSAGADVYRSARTLRTFRANLLDNPQGVSSLLDSSGPGGINRAVNVERVPDTVVRMPVDQFSHVVDTLNHVKTAYVDLAPQAQDALSEIRSQFMLRMQEQGQKFKGNVWNNRGVSQYLNANSAKLAKVFSPADLRRLQTLNRAGNILDVDRTYPGAAVQSHNLAQRGILAGIERGGEFVGGHVGGPVGAMVGGAAGGKIAAALGGRWSRKAARSRIVKL